MKYLDANIRWIDLPILLLLMLICPHALLGYLFKAWIEFCAKLGGE